MKFKDFINKEDKLIENLAELEHEQWMDWAKSIIKTENISKERVKRWKTLFIKFKNLSEEMKNLDREWAKKVLKILKDSKNEF